MLVAEEPCLPLTPEKDRFRENIGAGRTLESDPVRAIRCEEGGRRVESCGGASLSGSGTACARVRFG